MSYKEFINAPLALLEAPAMIWYSFIHILATTDTTSAHASFTKAALDLLTLLGEH
jgi:hypothetical protein